MKKKSLIIISCFICTVNLFSCKEDEAVDYQTNECKRQPAFIASKGINPARAAFSTSEKKIMGLVLLELQQTGDTAGKKIYQDPSWQTGGWLGPIQLDAEGNCFTAPVPVINLLNNPPAKQNIIYGVNSSTGIMSSFCELPVAETISSENPYGVLGLAYLCESNTLYAASVQGSSRGNEAGTIYAINASDGKIEDKITGTDPLGMGISYITGKRKLYVGLARTSDVYSIELQANGKFSGKLTKEFSIEGLGPRGDDKVRKIRFDKAGNMQVYGIEFNFNLAAPTEKQENVYVFSWKEEQNTWISQ